MSSLHEMVMPSYLGTELASALDSEGVFNYDEKTRDLADRLQVAEVVLLLGYSVMFLLCVVLVLYMRHNRSIALKGDSSAARKLLLPAFEPLFWTLGVTTGIYCVVLALALGLDWDQKAPRIILECIYGAHEFVLLLVVVYMLQKSVSVPALLRSIGITLVLAMYTVPIEIALRQITTKSSAGQQVYYILLTLAHALILLLIAYVAVRPPGRASKRSLREYCLFALIYYVLTFVQRELFQRSHLEASSVMLYITLIWGTLTPLVIWRVLVADTQHWRGLGQRAVALQTLFRQKNNINERISSQGLHVLIEMHRKLIIDFAYLEIKRKIGTGSSAAVFNGVLHSRTPVAIKVYTPSEFSDETVAAFSQETALCGALNHPNIVKFYGMCVCPPTICLVSELCQGSLDDITRASSHRLRANMHQSHRQQHLIDLTYMLDAARAVAYIHSFSPPFIHRDIKPGNFLVDARNTVKLTDFGESRSLPHAQIRPAAFNSSGNGKSRQQAQQMKVIARGDSSTVLSQDYSAGDGRGRFSLTNGSSNDRDDGGAVASKTDDEDAKMTVKGTVDYMAPEIINGRAGLAQYGEAADVYSLAVTMWDILNPGQEKFPNLKNNHLKIFEFVVDGKRPALSEDLHPSIREVITNAWHSDPRRRPAAEGVVATLENVQEELFAVLAADLALELDQEVLVNKHGDPMIKVFPAQHGVAVLMEKGCVAHEPEAVRMGNALMDAGLLHHLKHERPFENSDAHYFFDEDSINLCRPLFTAAHEEYGGSGCSISTSDGMDGEDVDHVLPLPGACGEGGVGSSRGPIAQHPRRSTVDPLRRPRSIMARRKPSTATSMLGGGRTTGLTVSARSEQAVCEQGPCACRRLGQRLEAPKTARGHHKRFRKHRAKAVSEENLLTAKLLAAEHNHEPVQVNDFDGFADVDLLDFHEEDEGEVIAKLV